MDKKFMMAKSKWNSKKCLTNPQEGKKKQNETKSEIEQKRKIMPQNDLYKKYMSNTIIQAC